MFDLLQGGYAAFDNITINASSSGLAAPNDLTGAGLGLYPNPANQEVQLTGKVVGKRAELYDAQGKLAASLPIEAGGRLRISHLPKGLYLIKVQGGHQIQRLMVNR